MCTKKQMKNTSRPDMTTALTFLPTWKSIFHYLAEGKNPGECQRNVKTVLLTQIHRIHLSPAVYI